ncbi:hypothetical protein C9I49_05265 [Pseudomonas prosekii]|uniref:Uncharacterized protein n=1 Tax=Pseudomonas prosekii TaxID=1148509 RepID=A0A2U2DCG8_9PSED|nr:hypothetical protein C9I49_05265 [Pseudomonas prosekii]
MTEQQSCVRRTFPVGASLLAIRPAHSTSSLSGTPLSRASSLPQGLITSVVLRRPCLPRSIAPSACRPRFASQTSRSSPRP